MVIIVLTFMVMATMETCGYDGCDGDFDVNSDSVAETSSCGTVI